MLLTADCNCYGGKLPNDGQKVQVGRLKDVVAQQWMVG